jgi:hypothetical protein
MYYDKYLGSYSKVNTDSELDLNMKNKIRKVEKIVEEWEADYAGPYETEDIIKTTLTEGIVFWYNGYIHGTVDQWVLVRGLLWGEVTGVIYREGRGCMRETPNLNKRLVCRPDSYGLSGALTTAQLYDIIYVSVSEQLYGTPREKLNGLNPRIIYSWRDL